MHRGQHCFYVGVGLTDAEKNELVDAFYGTDIQRLEAIEAKLKEGEEHMNELEFNCLIELLEDDFEGDYSITRTELLGLLKRAKWNAKVIIKNELEEAKGQALAQPEQEPAAWMGVDSYGNVIKFRTNEFGGGTPLYTAPPKREWVGLGSDEDILEMSKEAWGRDKLNRTRTDHRQFYVDFAREIDRYLKEKNHG
jgi:hypothetical protein